MGLWKDKTRKDWRYSFQHRGKTYAGGGFKTRREATAGRQKRRQEANEEIKKKTGTAFSIIANTYLDYSERRFAKLTYKYKALIYRRFIEACGDRNIYEVTPQEIHDFLATLPSNYSYNAGRKELSALCEYAINKLQLPLVNPCKKLDKMPHNPAGKRIPTEEEIIKLIIAADPKTDEQDLLLVLLHTLARIDEILRMKWDDVNFERREVTLWTRKRKDGSWESDVQPMNETLHEILKKRWKARMQDEWVFYNEETETRYHHRPKYMAGLCKRAGISPVKVTKRKIRGKVRNFPLYYGFHTLRHFMANHLRDKEKRSLAAISSLLRHRTQKTTEIYFHTLDESARSAMDAVASKFAPNNQNPQALTASINEKEVTPSHVTSLYTGRGGRI